MNWYEKQHGFIIQMSAAFGLPRWKVAAVISALSPTKPWRQNRREAQLFFMSGIACHNRHQREKCRKIMAATCPIECWAILNGEKTRCFWLNLGSPLGSRQVVTIDRHVLAHYNAPQKPTSRQYHTLAELIRHQATAAGMYPQDYQAYLWVLTKANKGHNFKYI